MLVIDEAELDCLGQPLRLLLRHDEVICLGVSLDSELSISDEEYIARDPRHDEVVQMVVQWRASLLQAWICLRLHLVAIAGRQAYDSAGVADVLDQLIRRLAQIEDLSWQEDSNDVLEVCGELLLEGAHLYYLARLQRPLLVEIDNSFVQFLLN